MEGRSPGKTLPSNALLLSFLLLLLSQTPGRASSQPLSSDPISFQSPTPSPPSTPHTTPNRAHALTRILLSVLLGSLTGFAASIIILCSIRLFILFASRTPILNGPVVFSPNISPKTLQLALSSQTQPAELLGSGPNGKYYKVTLDDELVVAVKVMDSSCAAASPNSSSKSMKRRAQRELELLARVKHRNVMSLRAYIRDHHHHDRLSLVYDYISGGSLEDAMKMVRAQQLQLGWEARHRIAVGVVKGLRHLHFECSPRILHYCLKPTNVMLDEGFEPRLGDCGLARLVPTSVDVVGGGAAFYIAPECLQSCRYTDKSDIFSFGVILGELLTGRDPSDPFFVGDSGRGSLGRWLRQLQQAGEAREALDKGILGEEVEEEEMLMAVRIALVCLSDLPADRPSSDELVAMLTQLHSF